MKLHSSCRKCHHQNDLRNLSLFSACKTIPIGYLFNLILKLMILLFQALQRCPFNYEELYVEYVGIIIHENNTSRINFL